MPRTIPTKIHWVPASPSTSTLERLTYAATITDNTDNTAKASAVFFVFIVSPPPILSVSEVSRNKMESPALIRSRDLFFIKFKP